MPTRFLLTIIALLSALGSTGNADDRPNIILLMGDDHGWSETGYNGHPYLQTPVLDEMAANGLQLDHFYAAHPSCSPTRGSFLTGRHPNRYGTFTPGWSIRPDETTIAHLLSDAGYYCGHFGKWHLGPVKAESPTNPKAMGFHHYVSHDNFYEMNPAFSRNGAAPEVIEGEGSKVTIDATLDFIKDATNREMPFLAVVWFGSPHEPYSGLKEDLDLYADLPAEFADRKVKLTSMETGRPVSRPLRDVLQERYAEITAMDRAIGTLRDELTAKGLKENTLLWYCGDNGAPRSAGRATTPFRAEKAYMYEGGIRVPGVIEWPKKIRSHRVSEVNAVTSDILPTLCAFGGAIPPKRPLDGISLAPLFEGKMTQRPQPIFFWSYDVKNLSNAKPAPVPYIDPELQEGTTPLVKYMGDILTRNFKNYEQPPITEADYNGSRVMLGNQYKLVIDGEKGSGVELFDIRSDSAEKKNLSESEPKIVEQMKTDLRTWQESVLQSLSGADY